MLKIIAQNIRIANKEKGLNTSAEVVLELSSHVDAILKQAQVHAKNAGRKTVMRKDIEAVVTDPKRMACAVVNQMVGGRDIVPEDLP